MKYGETVTLDKRRFVAAPEKQEGGCMGCAAEGEVSPLCSMCTAGLYEVPKGPSVIFKEEKRKARLIVTRACNRSCAGCCNGYIGKGTIPEPRRVGGIEPLMDYEEVMITGGEPALVPMLSVAIAESLRRKGFRGRILMYSATFDRDFYEKISPFIDGIHFTLHAEATERDVFDFMAFQDWAFHSRSVTGVMSLRAYIDPRVKGEVVIRPGIFQRLEVKPWINEGECPPAGGRGIVAVGRGSAMNEDDSNCPELEEELRRGDEAADELAKHVIRMGAGGHEQHRIITSDAGAFNVTILVKVQQISEKEVV